MGICGSLIPANVQEKGESIKPEPEGDFSDEEEEENLSGLEDEFVFEYEDAIDQIEIAATKRYYPFPIATGIFDKLTVSSKDKVGSHCGSARSTPRATPKWNQRLFTLQQVDEHARKAPRSVLKSFSELVYYLTDFLLHSRQRDKLAARAIITWMSIQNVYNIKSGTGNTDTPEGYLALLRQKKTTYSTLFTILCRKADIMCVQIRGVTKCGSYKPGDTDFSELGSSWNAIYVDGNWKLVHPFWVCVGLQKLGGWIKLEYNGGQRVLKRQRVSARSLRNVFKEFFFLSDPKEFIYICQPNDDKWQLLENPISRDQFQIMPYLLPTFFNFGLKFKSEPHCLLQTENGFLSIKLEAPWQNENAFNMWYEIHLIESSAVESDTEDDRYTPKILQRVVTMVRCGEEWEFGIQFPVEGTYKLNLYGGPYKTPLLKVCEFRIDCVKCKDTILPLPFDPGIVGFGPGPLSEDAGLFVPFQRRGLIPTKVNGSVKIIFQIEGDILHSLEVICELTDHQSEQRTRVQSEIDHERKLLKIIVVVLHEGEFSLTIFTKSGINFISRRANADGFQNICNYLISTTTVLPFERANKSNARKALEEMYESEDIVELNDAIEKCLKEKINSDDDQILAAKARLGYLETRKVIKESFQRRNTGIVVKGLKRLDTSPYRDVFRSDIDSLKKFRLELEAAEPYTQTPPEIRTSLLELACVLEPTWEIYDTLRALLLLLEEPESSLKCWEDVVELVHPGLGKHTALYRIRAIEENRKTIDIHNARKAARLLHQYTLDDVRRINMAAATVYKWIDAALRSSLNEDERSSVD